jgi:hypothetical protein
VRIGTFHPAAGDSLVQAIRIVPEVEGDAVRVKVSTMYGERLFDKELLVATYLLTIDDKVRVDELKKYGIQPFALRLIKVFPSTANLPTVVTHAPSISALSVQPNDSSIPSVTVKLRNLSYKEIVAIGVKVFAGDKIRTNGVPRGNEGHNLIEAGGLYDYPVRIAQVAQAGPNGYVPVSAPNQKVLITAVLFRDGTFEGDAEMASRAAGYNLGAKIMLGKMLPIFDQALAAGDANPIAVLEELRSRVSALTADVDPKVAEELAGKFPSLSTEEAGGLKNIIDIGSGGIKTDMLKSLDADKVLPSDQTSKDSFHVLLSRIREGIKDWQERL